MGFMRFYYLVCVKTTEGLRHLLPLFFITECAPGLHLVVRLNILDWLVRRVNAHNNLGKL